MKRPPPSRASFLTHALNLIGTPYLWGGRTHQGIDCSGVVALALYEVGGPDWRLTKNTDRMWLSLPPTDEPLPGDLAFYGGRGDDVHHVMVYVAYGVVFGACGGDATTLTLVEAQRRGARVRARERVMYRRDLRGYRSLSSILE